MRNNDISCYNFSVISMKKYKSKIMYVVKKKLIIIRNYLEISIISNIGEII